MTPIIAIDPGPVRSSMVEWDGKRVLRHVTDTNDAVLELCRGRVVVIEWITGYGLTVGQEVFDTCRWVGRFEATAAKAHLVSRRAVKLQLCETTQARDTHIRAALLARIGPTGTKRNPGPTHGLAGGEWSALAVAVTWWDQRRRENK